MAFLGGVAKGYETNFLMGQPLCEDTIVVIEADEYDRCFLHLHPDIAVITTIDPDHLDIYDDAQGYKEAFQAFINRLPTGKGQVIVHQQAAQELTLNGMATRYALDQGDVCATNVHIKDGYFYFDYVSEDEVIKNIQLIVPGYHNVENALAVITACRALGLDAETIRQGMATFQGIKRRFDYIIKRDDLVFLDDYGHHPAELAAVIRAARDLYPSKKLTVVFQPNLYTRTKAFAAEFAQSLDLADQVFLLNLCPQREAPIPGVNSQLIFDGMLLPSKVLCTTEDIVDQLSKHEQPEVIVNIGIGSSATSQMIEDIKMFLLERAS